MVSKLKSPLEHEFAAELEADPTVDHFEYEPETFYVTIIQAHKPDWKVYPKEGEPYFVETKGFLRKANRDLIDSFLKTYPDIDYRMVFENPYKTLQSKTKARNSWSYAKWCERRNVPWGWTNRFYLHPSDDPLQPK